MDPNVLWLEAACRQELDGCRIVADDGTVLFTPDGAGNYGALWTRDFFYMVENAWDLMNPLEIRAAILTLLRGQRADGCMPDRVQADGRAVYSAGPVDAPLGAPPTDNAQFMALLVHRYVTGSADLDLGRASIAALQRGLRAIPLGATGLVHIQPGEKRSPYGFTDTVAKSGDLLFSSLLLWAACRAMADLLMMLDMDSRLYDQQAELIADNLDILWDDEVGAYRAATVACNQIDIWGNAYAATLGILRPDRQAAVLRFLHAHYADYVYRGQVRHLLTGETWEALLMPVEPGTYQNGAYWATASGWVMLALAQLDSALARAMARDLIEDFQAHGICECINWGYIKLPHYVVSAVNPLPAVRQLLG